MVWATTSDYSPTRGFHHEKSVPELTTKTTDLNVENRRRESSIRTTTFSTVGKSWWRGLGDDTLFLVLVGSRGVGRQLGGTTSSQSPLMPPVCHSLGLTFLGADSLWNVPLGLPSSLFGTPPYVANHPLAHRLPPVLGPQMSLVRPRHQ